MHEVVHGLLQSIGEIELYSNEILVEGLAQQLQGLIKENKQLMKIMNNIMRTNELALQQTLNKFLVTTIYGAKEKDRYEPSCFLFSSVPFFC